MSASLDAGRHGYALARDRGRRPPPSATQRFERYEAYTLALAGGTTFALVGQFSGRPDRITVQASGGTGEFRLTDRVGREESTIRHGSIVPFDTQLSRERVEARDPLGVGGFNVFVVGYYASRDEDELDDEPAELKPAPSY